MAQPFWEAAYGDLDSVTFGGEPSIELRDVAAVLPEGAKVLDLGCGEGRNAFFLAECGFDVTAVDVSEAGIRKLRVLAERRGLTVRTEVRDMRSYPLPDSFDLVVSHGCLHLVEREAWQRLIAVFKAGTNAGGYNIIAVFTDTIAPPEDLREFCAGLFGEGELFSLYQDWQPVLQRSYVLEEEHPGSPPHRHPINKLVARKPEE